MTKLVVLFNWHFFLIAAVACVAGIIAFAIVPILWIRVVLAIGVISGIYFIVASVIASYFVYDHSDLYRLKRWPDRVIPEGATGMRSFGPKLTAIAEQENARGFFDPGEHTIVEEVSVKEVHVRGPWSARCAEE